MTTRSAPLSTLEIDIHCASTTTAPVLISAQPGADIESVARVIHGRSVRCDLAFLTVDCAAESASALQAALSTGGTVYLREVCQLNLRLCAILSRALASHVRVARIIAGTTRDLSPAGSEDALSEDLFYRLNVIHVVLPHSVPT